MDHDRIRAAAEVWGRAYLLHPALVSADPPLDWEGALAAALPRIEQAGDAGELAAALNEGLLSRLGDPLTFVQPVAGHAAPQSLQAPQLIDLGAGVGWLSLTNPRFLARPAALVHLDGLIRESTRFARLVVDLRWETCSRIPGGLEALLGFFTDRICPGRLSLKRVHEGWNEDGRQYVFSQRLEVEQGPQVLPMAVADSDTRRRYRYADPANTSHTALPALMLVDNASYLFLCDALAALRTSRPNLAVAWERTGRFVIPPARRRVHPHGVESHLNCSVTSFRPDWSASGRITAEEAAGRVEALTETRVAEPALPAFRLRPETPAQELRWPSREERIVAACKAWTVLSDFFSSWDGASITPDRFLDEACAAGEGAADLPSYIAAVEALLQKLADPHAAVATRAGWGGVVPFPVERQVRYAWSEAPAAAKWLQPSIACIAPFEFPTASALHAALDEYHPAAGLILDLRGYPKCHLRAALIGRLCRAPVRSADYAIPLVRDDPQNRRTFVMQHFTVEPAGRCYDAPVVALIDATTTCAAEDLCVLLRTARRATFVGSATAGSQGNVTYLRLPGGLRVTFTGMRVAWGDGTTPWARVTPDVEIGPADDGEDAILSRALHVLESMLPREKTIGG